MTSNLRNTASRIAEKKGMNLTGAAKKELHQMEIDLKKGRLKEEDAIKIAAEKAGVKKTYGPDFEALQDSAK